MGGNEIFTLHDSLMQTKIVVKHRQGRISLIALGQELGHLTFEIRHRYYAYAYSTEVHPASRGQGIGARLVAELVAYCHDRRLLIRPLCPYIAKLRDETLATCLDSHDVSEEIIEHLRSVGSPVRARELQRFFKTGSGQYGEGDLFIGVSVPEIRQTMRTAMPLGDATIAGLCHSPIHEARLLGFLALVERANRCEDLEERKHLYDMYLGLKHYCNSWDLVDQSAPTLVGDYLAHLDDVPRAIALDRLADEPHLWTQRIAMVGTFGLIRRGQWHDTMRLAEKLMEHEHDLMHKAIGWMLREVGKRVDRDLLTSWLDTHAPRLPRTSLRYAIEHLDPDQRQYYMSMR